MITEIEIKYARIYEFGLNPPKHSMFYNMSILFIHIDADLQMDSPYK